MGITGAVGGGVGGGVGALAQLAVRDANVTIITNKMLIFLLRDMTYLPLFDLSRCPFNYSMKAKSEQKGLFIPPPLLREGGLVTSERQSPSFTLPRGGKWERGW